MAKKGLVVDFTGVESGGRTRVPEDDYRVKVKSVKQETAKSSGNPMLVWEFEIIEGKFKGKTLRDNTTLTNKSLWKLKQVLEAMGVEVPSKRVALKLNGYVGKELGVTTTDDEYEGRVSSKISDYVSIDVLEGIEDEDEDEDEEEDEDLEDEDEEEDEDEDEDEDEEEEEEPPKRKKGSKKGSKKGKKSKKAADDEDEEIEDLDLDEI